MVQSCPSTTARASARCATTVTLKSLTRRRGASSHPTITTRCVQCFQEGKPSRPFHQCNITSPNHLPTTTSVKSLHPTTCQQMCVDNDNLCVDNNSISTHTAVFFSGPSQHYALPTRPTWTACLTASGRGTSVLCRLWSSSSGTRSLRRPSTPPRVIARPAIYRPCCHGQREVWQTYIMHTGHI